MSQNSSKNKSFETEREDDSPKDSNNTEDKSEKEENVTGPGSIVDSQADVIESKKGEDFDKIDDSPNQDLNIGEGSQKGAECQDIIEATNPEHEQLSDADQKQLKRLTEELRKMSLSTIRGVKNIVVEEQDVGFSSGEDFDLVKNLARLEEKFNTPCAYTVAKNFVNEIMKATHVTLCDTKEMKELERWHTHEGIKRGGDGKVYEVKVSYTLRAWKSNKLLDTSDSSTDRADSEVKPIKIIYGYKITVREMQGEAKDIPLESELAKLRF